MFWIPTSVSEAAAVTPNGAKISLAKGTAAFINGPANLLNNEPKNRLDWIILGTYILDNFISVDILFSIAFLNLVVCLAVNNNSWGNFFH